MCDAGEVAVVCWGRGGLPAKVSTLSISTTKHQATPVPRARVDRAGKGKPRDVAHAGQRPAPRSGGAGDADIRRLLQRLGRRWSQGGSLERRRAIEAARPYLGKLGEADRAVKKASLAVRLATGRVTVLESSVAKHRRRRDELVQQVRHVRYEASTQKSTSRGAALRRTSSEWEEELRAYDEKFGERPNELAAARSDAHEKQVELRLRRKQVTQLEAGISHLLSSVTRSDDGGGGSGSGNRARAAGVSGARPGGKPPLEDRDPSTGPKEHGSVARVRTEQASGRRLRGRTDDRQARQGVSAAGTSRGGVDRGRRR